MGRHKNIETPEIMWKLFEAYKQHVANNPILVQDFVGKDGEEVRREKQRPLTMEGFECFVMDNTNVTYPDLSQYFEAKSESYRSFFPVCSRIRREIRQNQIEGGMAGIYNPSITQRLNGLVEKSAAEDRSEVTIKVKYEEPRADSNPE